MKKNLLFILIIAVFVYSCKKSDITTHSIDPAGNITGTWYIISDTTKDYTNGTLSSTTGTSVNRVSSFKFNADNTGEFSTDTIPGSANFTYTIANNKVAFNYPDQVYNNINTGATTDTARIALITTNNLELIFKGYFFTPNGVSAYYEQDVYLTNTPKLAE